MKINAATGFLLAGLAVLLLARRRPERAHGALACALGGAPPELLKLERAVAGLERDLAALTAPVPS